jgi:hypothetical protein
VPGPPASGGAYYPKGNAGATRSRPPRSERKNSDALAAHGFLPREKPRGSHATNAGNSKRLKPLTECFLISPKNSRAPENPRQKGKFATTTPPNLLRLKPTPILYFEQLARDFNRPTLRLTINVDEQKSQPKPTIPRQIMVLAHMPSAPESRWPPHKEGFKLISESRSQ